MQAIFTSGAKQKPRTCCCKNLGASLPYAGTGAGNEDCLLRERHGMNAQSARQG
jgi:hypothetical protein